MSFIKSSSCKFVLDISRANGKRSNINHFKETEDYNAALEYCRNEILKSIGDVDFHVNDNLKDSDVETYMM